MIPASLVLLPPSSPSFIYLSLHNASLTPPPTHALFSSSLPPQPLLLRLSDGHMMDFLLPDDKLWKREAGERERGGDGRIAGRKGRREREGEESLALPGLTLGGIAVAMYSEKGEIPRENFDILWPAQQSEEGQRECGGKQEGRD
eukprot:754575-Hanusia_phi.AAC.1